MTPGLTSTMRLYRVQALRQTCSRILCSTASRCQHRHTGKLKPSVGYGLEHFCAEPAELGRQRCHAAEQADTCPQEIALQDGANVNVDETWLRYHAYNKKRKTYMWCLVNRKARIVIFFYEDTTDDEGVQKHGGRNRNVLKEFLGDAKSNHCRATATTYICILTTNLWI